MNLNSLFSASALVFWRAPFNWLSYNARWLNDLAASARRLLRLDRGCGRAIEICGGPTCFVFMFRGSVRSKSVPTIYVCRFLLFHLESHYFQCICQQRAALEPGELCFIVSCLRWTNKDLPTRPCWWQRTSQIASSAIISDIIVNQDFVWMKFIKQEWKQT